MDTISFDKLLLKTAFCCMACDGHIDNKEIDTIKTLCASSPLFIDFNFTAEINTLVTKLNERGKEFISYYFELLNSTSLSEQEELLLIDFAIKTINADENLKVSDEKILSIYPDIESWLEQDIITNNYLDKIKDDYLKASSIPKFEQIQSLDKDLLDSINSEKTD